MKAAVCTRFGAPEVLEVRDVPAPVPKSSETVDKLGLKLRRTDLFVLAKMLENDQFKPVIDRIYSLGEIVEAHRRVETRHKRGSVP